MKFLCYVAIYASEILSFADAAVSWPRIPAARPYLLLESVSVKSGLLGAVRACLLAPNSIVPCPAVNIRAWPAKRFTTAQGGTPSAP